MLSAGVNLARIAKGRDPLSFADEANVQVFNEAVQTWLADASELAEKQIVRPGYLDVDVVET